jgi:hypothetical protein
MLQSIQEPSVLDLTEDVPNILDHPKLFKEQIQTTEEAWDSNLSEKSTSVKKWNCGHDGDCELDVLTLSWVSTASTVLCSIQTNHESTDIKKKIFNSLSRQINFK